MNERDCSLGSSEVPVDIQQRFQTADAAPLWGRSPSSWRSLRLGHQVVPIAVPGDEPGFVVASSKRDERGSQLLDGVEGPHPQQVLLQGSDEALCYAVALGLSHEGGRSFDPQEFDFVLKIAGHVVGATIVTQLQSMRHPGRDGSETALPRRAIARGSTIEQRWSHAMLTRDRRMIKNQIFKFRSPSRKYEIRFGAGGEKRQGFVAHCSSLTSMTQRWQWQPTDRLRAVVGRVPYSAAGSPRHRGQPTNAACVTWGRPKLRRPSVRRRCFGACLLTHLRSTRRGLPRRRYGRACAGCVVGWRCANSAVMILIGGIEEDEGKYRLVTDFAAAPGAPVVVAGGGLLTSGRLLTGGQPAA